ncbi:MULTISPECIES: DUF6708 domain-containing protein [unclassified Pseudomonas]|uniref:DUF6708 domain-containing protein n=1 Tax=unclassified Pseudomonas TaxID=196821 RepID=UPI002113A49F|nr:MULTISPECIES: DUF6708 domain-containing protein [unclassified Pseudomonas]
MNNIKREFGWQYDLPAPNKSCNVAPAAARIYPPPNHADNYYLEIPRTPLRPRGLLLFLGSSILFITATGIPFIAYDDPTWFFAPDIRIVAFLALVLGAVFVGIPVIRLDLEMPRHEPIRFNRLRRKVYFYQYRFEQAYPFGRKNWGVRPISYNWDDLTAEAYRTYVPLGYGGLKERIMLSVKKPETNEIIDRLFLCDDIHQGTLYWEIARAFMENGPEVLPNFVHPPRDWDEFPNPDPWENAFHRNPFDRLAPKVHWPADMDLESRTAPNPGDQK